MTDQQQQLGRLQLLALNIALNTGAATGGKYGDAPWSVIDSLRKRGLLVKCPRARNSSVLTDAGRAIALTLDPKDLPQHLRPLR